MYASCSSCRPGLTHVPEIVLWLYLGLCIEAAAVVMPSLYNPLMIAMTVPSLIAEATYCPLSEAHIDLVAQILDSGTFPAHPVKKSVAFVPMYLA
eukprot:14613102-Ditylum_brightwellii.AAC.1